MMKNKYLFLVNHFASPLSPSIPVYDLSDNSKTSLSEFPSKLIEILQVLFILYAGVGDGRCLSRGARPPRFPRCHDRALTSGTR